MEPTCINPEAARAYLADVQPLWRAFWMHMHLMVKNLDELSVALSAIDDDIYRYHAVSHEHQLARWVQEVIGDSTLAAMLRTATSREQAAELVARRVEELHRIRDASVNR